MNRNKKNILHIVCFFTLFFIFLWFLLNYLIGNLPFSLYTPLTGPLILSLLLTSAFVIIFLARRYSNLIKELNHSLKLIKNINNYDNLSEDEIETSLPVVSEINSAIAEISEEIRKQVQELNESEQRYHSLVINIPDIVLTLDKHGNITYGNRACRDVLNFRRHDIVGKPFQYIIREDYVNTFNYKELKQLVEKKGEQLMKIPLRRKDGSFIHTEIKFTPALESPQDSSIQAIIRDVTEQKQMENKLVENNRRLEIINRFSHKMASAMELPDIYKTCVNTLTEELEFEGAMYLMVEKKERFYRIAEYSGNYFNKLDSLECFSYIHRNIRSLYYKNNDGIVLDFDTFSQLLMTKQGKTTSILPFKAAYIQELNIGGDASTVLLVITNKGILTEEFDVLRSIGHTTAVAVENAMYLIKSKTNYVATIDALIAAVEARDQYTRGHSQRVSAFAVKIAEELGMNRQQIEELRIAGILHDIGKIGISDRILLKKGPLTKEEYEEIKKHPAISNKILYPIGLSDRILKSIAFHHERFDGRGYPFGLANESLGLEPQIIAVADAFDAMTSKRPYRQPLSIDEAIKELEDNKGSQFHPDIVDVMIKIQANTVKSLM